MFQRTSQDPKSTCYYLVLKYYFTSEQLKVFKENPCSLNTYLHAERGKELLDSENASFQHRSAALKCRTEWYADCIQVCIYFFAIDNRRRPFLQLLWIWWVRLCYSYIYIYIYIYIYSAYFSNCQRTGSLVYEDKLLSCISDNGARILSQTCIYGCSVFTVRPTLKTRK